MTAVDIQSPFEELRAMAVKSTPAGPVLVNLDDLSSRIGDDLQGYPLSSRTLDAGREDGRCGC
jgi:hypothetical protein